MVNVDTIQLSGLGMIKQYFVKPLSLFFESYVINLPDFLIDIIYLQLKNVLFDKQSAFQWEPTVFMF